MTLFLLGTQEPKLLHCKVALCAAIHNIGRNYQTGSEPTFLNDGKFLDNGRSGYVLKPSKMRDEKSGYNPTAKGKVAKTVELSVWAEFISFLSHCLDCQCLQIAKGNGKRTEIIWRCN
jgi:hypothetical protein